MKGTRRGTAGHGVDGRGWARRGAAGLGKARLSEILGSPAGAYLPWPHPTGGAFGAKIMLIWKEILDRIYSLYRVKTQVELGKALDVSPDLVSRWKIGKNKPTWKVLEKIVQEQSVSWSWLLAGKETETADAAIKRIGSACISIGLALKDGNSVPPATLLELSKLKTSNGTST